MWQRGRQSHSKPQELGYNPSALLPFQLGLPPLFCYVSESCDFYSIAVPALEIVPLQLDQGHYSGTTLEGRQLQSCLRLVLAFVRC